MQEYKSTVIEYFHQKAEDYDLTDDQSYWWFSDCLLWEILNEEVLSKLPGNFGFFDAGAGTARWTARIFEQYENSTGLLIDFSADMLNQAKTKITNNHWENRSEVIQADLDLVDLSDRENRYDLSFSFHNVLGFVKDPYKVIGKMSQVVKPGGYIVALVPNWYHNIFFNLKENHTDLAFRCFTSHKGKFTPDMPEMNMFTPHLLREYYNNLGIDIMGVYGFPISIYPGYQETQLHGETTKLKNIFEDQEMFQKLFDMEKVLYHNEDAAARGNQIIIIGKKK